MSENKQDQMNKVLFVNLVMMLGSSAMQQLGKLINPMTGKTEIDLEGAQITIDMLSMLITQCAAPREDRWQVRVAVTVAVSHAAAPQHLSRIQ